MERFGAIMDNLTRRKHMDTWLPDTPLRKSLTVGDLIWLGTAPLVGVGIYIMTGDVTRYTQGPVLILGFFVASVSAFLAAFSYAEFGSRVQENGSAYIYSYITLGEVWAFSIGWTMIFENLFAAASVTKLCSQYVNFLTNGTLYETIKRSSIALDLSGVVEVPDALSPALTLVVGVLISVGTKWTSKVISLLNLVSIVILVFIVATGFYFNNNWLDFTPKKTTSIEIIDIFAVAASSYYAFANLEIISVATEETSKSRTQVPLGIFSAMAIGTLVFLGTSVIITLMIPFQVPLHVIPMAEAFALNSFLNSKYIILSGGIIAAMGSMLAFTFTVARITYQMANDGLIFNFFGHVSGATRVPVRAALIDALIIGLLATFMKIKQLVHLLSIGTLISHIMVAVSVIFTRYQFGAQSVKYIEAENSEKTKSWLKSVCCVRPEMNVAENENTLKQRKVTKSPAQNLNQETLNNAEADSIKMPRKPNEKTSLQASVALVIILLGIVGLCLTLTLTYPSFSLHDAWSISLACVCMVVVVIGVIALESQPKNEVSLPVEVPWVPYLPLLGVFLNVLLLVMLDYWAFARFGAWLALGLLLYGLYGYRYSKEGLKPQELQHAREFVRLSVAPSFQQQVYHQQPSYAQAFNDTERQQEESCENICLDKQVNRELNGYKDEQVDRELNGYIDEQVNRELTGYTDEQVNRELDGYIDEQVNRELDGYIDEQVNKELNGNIDE